MMRTVRIGLSCLVVFAMVASFSVLSPPAAFAAPILVDSYPESNYAGGNTGMNEWVPAVGQAFTGAAGALDSAQFRLSRVGSPVGTVRAELYDVTGAYGLDTVAVGSPLAVSAPVDVLTIPDWAVSTGALVDFAFDGTFAFTPGAHYVIAVKCQFTGEASAVYVSLDDSDPTHPGNACQYSLGGGWAGVPGQDVIFYVYARPIPAITNLRADSTPVKRNVATEFHADVSPVAAAGDGTYTIHFEFQKRVKGKFQWLSKPALDAAMTADSAGTLSVTRTLTDVGTWRMYVTSALGTEYGASRSGNVEFKVSRR